MATIDRTTITKPSPIVEDEQGQLRARQGISRGVISELSKIKGEPDWMAERRLKSLEIFERKPIPTWGPDLSGLNLDDLVLYSPPTAGRYNSWDEVPAEMKQTYEDLGIPQAEREHLARVVSDVDPSVRERRGRLDRRAGVEAPPQLPGAGGERVDATALVGGVDQAVGNERRRLGRAKIAQ